MSARLAPELKSSLRFLGGKFWLIPMPQRQEVFVAWGFIDGFFIVTIGEL